MRLAGISLLALIASLGLTGCSANRAAGKGAVSPSGDIGPARQGYEYDPRDDRPTSPGSLWPTPRARGPQSPLPEPPPVPPAVGVSRVKSVSYPTPSAPGLIRPVPASHRSVSDSCSTGSCGRTTELDTHCTADPPCGLISPEAADCAEGCRENDAEQPGCITRLYRKCRDNMRGLFGRRHTAAPCSDCSPIPADCCAPDSHVTITEPCAPACSGPNQVCAPRPGCGSFGIAEEDRLPYRAPGLADSLQDPILDQPTGIPHSATTPNTDRPEPLLTAPIPGHQQRSSPVEVAPPAPPSNPVTPVPGPPMPLNPVPETSIAPPAPLDGPDAQRSDNLPLWPRLQHPPRTTATSRPSATRIQPASTTVIQGVTLPEIIPRDRY